jgi:tetratricopeptide (TPR) repeat protein
MPVDLNLCACGSGLRAVRCCRLDRAALPTDAAVRRVGPIVDRLVELHRNGSIVEEEKLCLDLLDLAPTHAETLAALYHICNAAGRKSAAEALLRRIVQHHPNTYWATNALVLDSLNKGAADQAEIHARNAIRLAPHNPQSHYLMGMAMTEANRLHLGEYHYRRALELSGERDPIVLANLALNLKDQGKMTESRELYSESAEKQPDVLKTVLGWARMEEADQNFARALELLDRAEVLSPGDPGVLLSRAVLHVRMRRYEQAFQALDTIAAQSAVSPDNPQQRRAGLGGAELLEKGRLLDKLGRYDEAFDALSEGKRLYREISGLQYREDEAARLAQRLKTFFTERRLNALPRAGLKENVAQPLFILGFPRSGTTLVEQILCGHSRVSAAGELPFVNEMTAAMVRLLESPTTYPEALAELWMGDRRQGLDELRDFYLERFRQLGILNDGTGWFTDKMPLNEMHLGLISLVFPQSPLIHMLRHPLDAVLSTFSHSMTHGFNCSYALETTARYYVLVMELVEHYRAQIPMRYLAVRYEDVVTRQRDSVQRMLDFVGEPFEEECLNFHANRRYAHTASYAQVTEKLYATSCYRYRNYLKRLEPVIPMLEPIIQRLGYSID